MTLSTSEIVKLKKVDQKWLFQSEAHLEDFLWSCLEEILGCFPLRRQFYVAGQYCDILAVDTDKGLVIIELKNEEDRYVVSQISRYYDALHEEKPLTKLIDYSKSIQLIVIAPNFHRDNFTDKKYSQLPIQFLQFEILEQSEEFSFVLTDIDSQTIKKIKIKSEIKITSEEKSKETEIPEPPKKLLKLLAALQEDDRKLVFAIRSQILKCNDRIKEFSINSSIVHYGTSKNKLCAELREDKVRNTVALFLWLPHVTSRKSSARKIIARMRIWTDWKSVLAVGHVPKAIGRMISFDEWKSASVRPLNRLLPPERDLLRPNESPREKYFKDKVYREQFVDKRRNLYYVNNPYYKSGIAMFPEKYFEFIGRAGHSLILTDLVNLALETYSKKL